MHGPTSIVKITRVTITLSLTIHSNKRALIIVTAAQFVVLAPVKAILSDTHFRVLIRSYSRPVPRPNSHAFNTAVSK